MVKKLSETGEPVAGFTARFTVKEGSAFIALFDDFDALKNKITTLILRKTHTQGRIYLLENIN
jgi:metal-dependent amidase/aminoacylase/carboxypeptidase family protein